MFVDRKGGGQGGPTRESEKKAKRTSSVHTIKTKYEGKLVYTWITQGKPTAHKKALINLQFITQKCMINENIPNSFKLSQASTLRQTTHCGLLITKLKQNQQFLFTFSAVIQTGNLRNSASLPVLMSERPKMFNNNLTPNMVNWMLTDLDRKSVV